MQQFVINKNSTLPYLEIEPIHDGRHNYKKLYLKCQINIKNQEKKKNFIILIMNKL